MKHAIEILMIKWNEYNIELMQIPIEEKSYHYSNISENDKKRSKLESQMDSCIKAIVELKIQETKSSMINDNRCIH